MTILQQGLTVEESVRKALEQVFVQLAEELPPDTISPMRLFFAEYTVLRAFDSYMNGLEEKEQNERQDV